MMDIEVYIEGCLKKGMDMQEIKSSLYSSGYPSDFVDSAIRKLYKKQVIDLAKYISKKLDAGLSPLTMRNYLVGIGHPASQVDDAIRKIVSAKKYLLRRRKLEKTKEQLSQIRGNIKVNISSFFSRSGSYVSSFWNSLKPWQKGAYPASALVFVVLFFWVIVMMINSMILSGSLNCYSFGRVVSCSFFESLLFYLLVMLAFLVIFCLPVFGLGALVGHLVWRLRK